MNPRATTGKKSAAPRLTECVLTVAEFSAKVRCSPRHILDLVEEGKIPAINIGNNPTGKRFLRIPVEELAKFKKGSFIG